ncbi:hypothetical protein MRB53_034144 [Persea americana]|uniref:Uncharacterized protein n=1 Tax=Persea americana TaxID=3435 RepID=A0ACC2KWN3_PERAE|nr:hypothetical protein MRB53_034144 [Persea americana]
MSVLLMFPVSKRSEIVKLHLEMGNNSNNENECLGNADSDGGTCFHSPGAVVFRSLKPLIFNCTMKSGFRSGFPEAVFGICLPASSCIL